MTDKQEIVSDPRSLPLSSFEPMHLSEEEARSICENLGDGVPKLALWHKGRLVPLTDNQPWASGSGDSTKEVLRAWCQKRSPEAKVSLATTALSGVPYHATEIKLPGLLCGASTGDSSPPPIIKPSTDMTVLNGPTFGLFLAISLWVYFVLPTDSLILENGQARRWTTFELVLNLYQCICVYGAAVAGLFLSNDGKIYGPYAPWAGCGLILCCLLLIVSAFFTEEGYSALENWLIGMYHRLKKWPIKLIGWLKNSIAFIENQFPLLNVLYSNLCALLLNPLWLFLRLMDWCRDTLHSMRNFRLSNSGATLAPSPQHRSSSPDSPPAPLSTSTSSSTVMSPLPPPAAYGGGIPPDDSGSLVWLNVI